MNERDMWDRADALERRWNPSVMRTAKWYENWPNKPVINEVPRGPSYVRPVGVTCFIAGGVRSPI